MHNLDDSLYMLLKQKARAEGKSLNRIIQELLADSLGIGKGKVKAGRRKDLYAQLCGVMPPEELKRVSEAEKDFEAVDEKDWQ